MVFSSFSFSFLKDLNDLTMETLIRRRVLFGLCLHCLSLSDIMDARLI